MLLFCTLFLDAENFLKPFAGEVEVCAILSQMKNVTDCVLCLVACTVLNGQSVLSYFLILVTPLYLLFYVQMDRG